MGLLKSLHLEQCKEPVGHIAKKILCPEPVVGQAQRILQLFPTESEVRLDLVVHIERYVDQFFCRPGQGLLVLEFVYLS